MYNGKPLRIPGKVISSEKSFRLINSNSKCRSDFCACAVKPDRRKIETQNPALRHTQWQGFSYGPTSVCGTRFLIVAFSYLYFLICAAKENRRYQFS